MFALLLFCPSSASVISAPLAPFYLLVSNHLLSLSTWELRDRSELDPFTRQIEQPRAPLSHQGNERVTVTCDKRSKLRCGVDCRQTSIDIQPSSGSIGSYGGAGGCAYGSLLSLKHRATSTVPISRASALLPTVFFLAQTRRSICHLHPCIPGVRLLSLFARRVISHLRLACSSPVLLLTYVVV